MGKFISKQGIQNFGEAFLSSIEQQRRLQQQQEQFDEQMGFRERQSDLTEVYRQGLFAQNQEQEARLREGQKIDLIKGGFTPVQEGFSPDDMTKQGGGHYFPTLDVGGNLYKYPEQEAPKQNWELTTLKKNGKDVRHWINKNDPTQEPIPIDEVWHAPTGTGGGDKETKLPALTEKYQVDAFNRLKNPESTQKAPEGVDPTLWMIMGGGKQYNSDSDFGIVANKLLDAPTVQLLDKYIKNMGGYPTPEQLVEHITEQYGKGKIKKNQIDKLENFMDFYSQFQGNMSQPPREEMMRTK